MNKVIKAIWHGIKAVFTAVVDWLARLFGMKDNSKYGRILHRIVGTAFAVVVIFWALTSLVRFCRSIYWNLTPRTRDSYIYLSDRLNDNLFYYADCYGDKGYLSDSSGRKILKHILCIKKPLEGDSLVYYSDGERRGYFHMRDGRVVVPPTYEHAWIFSNGLAAVEVDRQIKFIRPDGKVAIDRGFCYDEADDGYVFHEGHCAVNDGSGHHMGLIDTNGNWVLPPKYTFIYPQDTFWVLRSSDKQGILTFGMDTVIPMTQADLDIEDTAILVSLADHTQHRYSLQGELIAANQIRDVEQLMYNTQEVMFRKSRDYDEELEEYYSYDKPVSRQAIATCFKYEGAPGWYGLLSPDGQRLTPPQFMSIEAVGKDLYFCQTLRGYGILLNSRGQEVKN